MQAFQILLREAQITAQLNHPCVPQILSVGYRTEDEVPFITMSWESGTNLRTAIFQSYDSREGDYFRSSSFYRFLSALVDISRALAYCHARGVIHSDPKPSNIVVCDSGKTLLIDWGMARVIGSTEQAELEITADVEYFDLEGTVVGTPAYMAPEQAKGDIAAIDSRTDVFGLGATLFHILTRRPPLHDDVSSADVISLRASGEIPRSRSFEPWVPEVLDEICARAMHPRPTSRHGSASEFADELAQWMLQEKVAII